MSISVKSFNSSSSSSLQSDYGLDPYARSSLIDMLKKINEFNLAALLKHRRTTERPGYFCVLCKKNGETEEFYQSHTLRDPQGRVTCPILVKHVCEICGATGPLAHTRSYCPFLKKPFISNCKPSNRYRQFKYRKCVKN
uniref:Nanos-type domain-containing protein n=1 Tax=Tetranychus urticae TaxID=32264 RepID=T1KF12_TETUR